jgi:Flp pilus assembly protein TadB
MAVLALAAAVLLATGPSGSARLRVLANPAAARSTTTALRPAWVGVGGAAAGALTWAATRSVPASAIAAAVVTGLGVMVHRSTGHPSRATDDPADLAAAWEQLAVCLEVGLPVAAAVAAAAQPLDGPTGVALRRVAGLLELGADPTAAWRYAEHTVPLAAFARAAARSAGTGAALAHTARGESARIRAVLADDAEARAQRAGVLITGPLGLCFLPAFLVLGIAPVVIGLATEALARW